MKLIKKNFFSKTQHFLLMALCAMPLMPNAIISILIICYSVLSLLGFIGKPESKFSPIDKKYFLSQTLYYFWILGTFLYSDDKQAALNIFQHSITLLIFPFLSVINGAIDKNYLKNSIKVFITSSTILAAYISLALFSKYGISAVFRTSIVSHMIKENFFYLDVHPIYTSIFFVISIFFLLQKLFNRITKKKVLIFLPLILILVLGIGVLASKTIIILLLISVSYLMLVNKKISKRTKLHVLLGVLFLTVFIFYNVKTIHTRFADLINTFVKEDISSIKENSTYIRAQIYRCCGIIFKEHPYWGVGIGDGQNSLYSCYIAQDLKISSVSAHNYFLRILISSGVIGLFLFLYSIYILVKFALNEKSNTYLFLILSFIVLMLVEDYLFRAYGVILFCLVNHMFYLFNKPNWYKMGTKNNDTQN